MHMASFLAGACLGSVVGLLITLAFCDYEPSTDRMFFRPFKSRKPKDIANIVRELRRIRASILSASEEENGAIADTLAMVGEGPFMETVIEAIDGLRATLGDLEEIQ